MDTLRIIEAATPEAAAKIYQYAPDITTSASADNTRTNLDVYDLGVWIGLSGGGSPGLLIVATTLGARQSNHMYIGDREWCVQQQQWHWFNIINGQRIKGQSDLWDAGPGRFWPELAIGFDVSQGQTLLAVPKVEAISLTK